MKKMKFGFIGALAIGTAMFFTGCADECKDVVCNSGECVEGDCVCDAGYEGVDCSVAYNAKFSGTYGLTETCDSTGTDNYSVTVAPNSSDASKANFTGLYREAQASVPANIGADGLSFTLSTTDVGPGSIVSNGTCTANTDGSTINVVYKFTNETTNAFESCTAVLTRQ
jgi:hypothetical protein